MVSPAQATAGAAQVEDEARDQVPPVSSAPILPASATASEPASEPTHDYTTFDGIRKALPENKALRDFLERQRLDTENTVRQRLENEWKQERGSLENVTKHNEAVIRQLADRLQNGQPYDDLLKETPSYAAANAEWSRGQVLRGLAQQALELASEERRAELQSDLDAAVSAGDIEKVSARALETLQRKWQQDVRASLDFDALYTEDETFRKWADGKVEKEMTTERNAQQVERNALQVAPTTPSGTAAASTSDLVEHIVNMPESERMEYMTNLALSNPEEFERVEQALYAAAGIRQ